jgi:AP endonuclease-1
MDAKVEWNQHFERYIRDLDKKKPVIWLGDVNVAPTSNGKTCRTPLSYVTYDMVSVDLCNAKKNWNKTPGYTEAETTAFNCLLDPPESTPDVGKFVDVWRRLHSTDRQYSYFSYRFDCRTKGIGWRLDMCMCTALERYRYSMTFLFQLY